MAELPSPAGSGELAAPGGRLVGLWSVHEDYGIADGILRELGPVARQYQPGAYPQIATELAKVNERDPASVLAFARRWGLLGQQRLLELGIEAGRANLARPEVEPGVRVVPGDSLVFIGLHARWVHICQELVGLVQGGDSRALKSYLDGLRQSEHQDDEGSLRLTFPRGHLVQARRFPEAAPEELALWILEAVIGENFSFLKLGVRAVGVEKRIAEAVFCPALHGAVYWHLARFAMREIGLARCLECGRLFPKTDGRQRYCPPPFGARESLCAVRARTRRHRER